MSDKLEVAKEKGIIEVKPSKRDILLNNKVVYAFTIITKRFIDICAGVAGMCVLIPLTIILYIVKIMDKDKGPLFFSQERIGKDHLGEACDSEDVPGGVTIKNEKGTLRMQGVFSVENC